MDEVHTTRGLPLNQSIKIGIVGPCSAGKSTLIKGLRELGYDVHHIAQEHSYVPDMWQRITHPQLLIFLDVSFQVSQQRRYLDWKNTDFEDQQNRLAHARQHADLILDTQVLTIPEVLTRVIEFLKERAN